LSTIIYQQDLLFVNNDPTLSENIAIIAFLNVIVPAKWGYRKIYCTCPHAIKYLLQGSGNDY
jgi:hypothetical protein